MKNKFSYKMLIGSIITGVVYFFFGEFLYPLLLQFVPRYIATGIYFTLMFIWICLGVSLTGQTLNAKTNAVNNIKKIALTGLIMCFASILFEFLYDSNISFKLLDPNSYIFIIDDSGSMAESDPSFQRIKAIEETVKDKDNDFPYAVYAFSDESSLKREMLPKSQSLNISQNEPSGGTAIKGVLEDVYSDIENGTLDVGKRCKVVMLSDGYATDVLFFERASLTTTLNKYSKNGITISTIGLGQADESLMSLIAYKTGGTFIMVDQASQLENAMMQAFTNTSERTLITFRSYVRPNILYFVMRILFMTIMGLIIGFAKVQVCDKFLDTRPVIINSIVCSIVAALLIEVGMNTLGFSEKIIRALMCILYALTILKENTEINLGNTNNKYATF